MYTELLVIYISRKLQIQSKKATVKKAIEDLYRVFAIFHLRKNS